VLRFLTCLTDPKVLSYPEKTVVKDGAKGHEQQEGRESYVKDLWTRELSLISNQKTCRKKNLHTERKQEGAEKKILQVLSLRARGAKRTQSLWGGKVRREGGPGLGPEKARSEGRSALRIKKESTLWEKKKLRKNPPKGTFPKKG